MRHFLLSFRAAETLCAISGAQKKLWLYASPDARLGLCRHPYQKAVIEFTTREPSLRHNFDGLEVYDIRVNDVLVCCENDTQNTLARLANGFEISDTVADEILFCYERAKRRLGNSE